MGLTFESSTIMYRQDYHKALERKRRIERFKNRRKGKGRRKKGKIHWIVALLIMGALTLVVFLVGLYFMEMNGGFSVGSNIYSPSKTIAYRESPNDLTTEGRQQMADAHRMHHNAYANYGKPHCRASQPATAGDWIIRIIVGLFVIGLCILWGFFHPISFLITLVIGGTFLSGFGITHMLRARGAYM